MWPTDDPSLPPPTWAVRRLGDVVAILLAALVVAAGLALCQHVGFAP